jgi:hypothetical protein
MLVWTYASCRSPLPTPTHREGGDRDESGQAHVIPVWVVLDREQIVFTTGANTVKGRNLQRERACAGHRG